MGDCVVPVDYALLDGAEQIVLQGCFHSMSKVKCGLSLFFKGPFCRPVPKPLALRLATCSSLYVVELGYIYQIEQRLTDDCCAAGAGVRLARTRSAARCLGMARMLW
jgi:hypothetical protein